MSYSICNLVPLCASHRESPCSGRQSKGMQCTLTEYPSTQCVPYQQPEQMFWSANLNVSMAFLHIFQTIHFACTTLPDTVFASRSQPLNMMGCFSYSLSLAHPSHLNTFNSSLCCFLGLPVGSPRALSRASGTYGDTCKPLGLFHCPVRSEKWARATVSLVPHYRWTATPSTSPYTPWALGTGVWTWDLNSSDNP